MYQVYKITTVDGKNYIGCTSDLRQRLRSHLSTQPWMNKNNYTVEILLSTESKALALSTEAKMVLKYDSMNSEKGHNKKPGGGNNVPMLESTRVLIAQRQRDFVRRHGSPIKGRKKTKEHIEALSKSVKEKFSDPRNHPMFGKHPSLEARQNMSEGQRRRALSENPNNFLGHKHSEESKQKISISKAGKSPDCSGWNSRQVLNISTGKKYSSAQEAMKETGADKSAIGRCCSGKQKTALGYQWAYV